MSFSMPTSAMWTGTGAMPKRELPSLVTSTMRPESAQTKFAPVMPAWAFMYFAAEENAGAAGDGFRIVVVIGGDALAQEGAGDFAAVLVDDRLDDVGRDVVVELDDELAEVGLEALDAVFDEERIEVDFLGGHRLGLGQAGDAVALEDGEDGLAGVLAGGGEVDVGAARDERLFGLGEVIAEVVERVVLDGGGEFAQGVGIRIVLVEDLIAFVGAGGGAVEDRVLFFVGDRRGRIGR